MIEKTMVLQSRAEIARAPGKSLLQFAGKAPGDLPFTIHVDLEEAAELSVGAEYVVAITRAPTPVED